MSGLSTDWQRIGICAVPGCTAECAAGHLMCLAHWRLVPVNTQRAWYRSGRFDSTDADRERAATGAVAAVRALMPDPSEPPLRLKLTVAMHLNFGRKGSETVWRDAELRIKKATFIDKQGGWAISYFLESSGDVEASQYALSPDQPIEERRAAVTAFHRALLDDPQRRAILEERDRISRAETDQNLPQNGGERYATAPNHVAERTAGA